MQDEQGKAGCMGRGAHACMPAAREGSRLAHIAASKPFDAGYVVDQLVQRGAVLPNLRRRNSCVLQFFGPDAKQQQLHYDCHRERRMVHE